MGDDNAAECAKPGQSTRHRLVVCIMAIPMQFNPIAEAAFDVIQSERALHVPRDLHPLPGRQVIVNFATRSFNLGLHRFHFGVEALAEMLALKKSDLPTARKMLSDAQTTVKKLPTSEQAFFKPQIDRIVGLLPKG